jgi:hypothetical protein
VDIERALRIKELHIPGKLYKYREFKKRHLEAFSNNVLWMPSADTLNDPWEATVRFDVDRFLTENVTAAQLLEDPEILSKQWETGRDRPAPISNLVSFGTLRDKLTRELLNDSSSEMRSAALRALDGFTKEFNEEEERWFTEDLRSHIGVASLSANPTSNLMWMHYANGHRGFCIEYNFSSLEHDDPRRRMCFPVFYTRKSRDATRYIAKVDRRDCNIFFWQLMCMIKGEECAYEREWRIIYSDFPKFKLPMPRPSRILLGAHVNRRNERWIKRFCRERSIPLCKMQLERHRYELTFSDITV